ncbi:unnamed protein product [Gongylonema pulchrum]|uniref:Uncharacterized protein n=1 Tax=Gongylonema pulchrum TaxID=637853 RepID=A0A183F1E5_9BILA|nr:unnamed protein product [Gongylonema pulchrum]
MVQIRQILSSSNYPGELDLFSRERFRLMLIDLFTVILVSIRDSIENILQTRSDVRRPSALFSEGAINSRKLLIGLCNVEYVMNCSLPVLCRRLAENGVKYGDMVIEVRFFPLFVILEKILERMSERRRRKNRQ